MKTLPLQHEGVYCDTAPEISETIASRLRLKNLLVPFDFSETSKKALEYAVSLASRLGATVTLLHVFEPALHTGLYGYATQVDDPAWKKGIEERLYRVAAKALPPELLGETLIRCGVPSDVINAAAAEFGSDLIVIATHGYTGLKHILLGSTTESVVREAPCPVLVVRERQHEFV